MVFTNKPPKWDNKGVEPDLDLQNEGFKAGYKPPAPFFNYLFNRLTASINELHTKLSKVENTADKDKSVKAAVTATNDADGNIITDTYATKTEANALELTGTAAGNPITVTGAAAAPLNDIKVYGSSEQATTEGNQLFDAKIATFTKGGATITNNGDGSYTISGSGALTEQVNKHYDYTHEETVELIKSGNITLYTEKITYPYVYAQIRYNNDTETLGLQNQQYNTQTKEVLQEILDDETAYFRIGIYGSVDNDIVTGTITPMLYQDGDGTYEQFTGGKPSPSPEYPQAINSVGDNGSVKVTSHGKNILKSLEKTQTFNGITYTPNSDGTITVSGTATSSAALVLEYKNAVLGNYILSGSTTNTRLVARVVNKDGTFIYHTSYNGSVVEFEITEDVREYNVYCEVKGDITVNGEIMKPMLRTVGDDTYEPYKALTAAVPLTMPLYGIPVSSGGNYTDANGQQWICNELDFVRGVYIQRVKQATYNGSENWLKSTSTTTDYSYYLVVNEALKVMPLCDRLGEKADGVPYIGMSTTGSGKVAIVVNVSEYMASNTVESLKAVLAEYPINVLYALAEPIETPLTGEQRTALQSLQTYEGITNIFAADLASLAVEYFKNNDNGKAASLLKAENNKLWETIGDVNSVLESLIGGA